MTKNEISGAVRSALQPEIDKIHATSESVVRIEERVTHMPTKDEVKEEIKRHSETCHAARRAGKRWVLGLILPPIIGAAVGFLAAHVSGCESDPYDGPGEGGECSPVAATRCLGELAQVCSAEEIWETLYDCSEWSLTCSPVGECSEVDGGPDAG